MSRIVLTKTTIPTSPDANQVAIYVNNDGSFAKIDEFGTSTILGAMGPAGTNGTNGNTWLSGNGLPSDSNGVDGDHYFDLITSDIYKKVAGVWGSPVVNIHGQQGIQGIQGVQGIQGETGVGIPLGGTAGQYLRKNSVTDYDVTWTSLSNIASSGLYADLINIPTTYTNFTYNTPTINDPVLNRASFNVYNEKYHNFGNTTANTTLDLSISNVFDITLNTATTTFAFTTSGLSATKTTSFLIILRQDATGGRLVNWPSNVKWPSNIAPSLTTTANYHDIVTLITTNGGTTFYGLVGGLNFNMS